MDEKTRKKKFVSIDSALASSFAAFLSSTDTPTISNEPVNDTNNNPLDEITFQNSATEDSICFKLPQVTTMEIALLMELKVRIQRMIYMGVGFLRYSSFNPFSALCRAYKLDAMGTKIARIEVPAALALTADPLASFIYTAFIGHIVMSADSKAE